MLGAIHLKSPYIPFILSWPSNKKAIKYLKLALNQGEKTPSQVVYLARALYKDGKKDGLWTYWGTMGTGVVRMKSEITYKDGEKISAKYWNRKGESVDSFEEAEAK